MQSTIGLVLVPFYRGAVVFKEEATKAYRDTKCSRPLLSRSGCIYTGKTSISKKVIVLVPFYRGAVVFKNRNIQYVKS